MGCSQIRDVDVIAETRPIRRGVVGAEDSNLRLTTHCRIKNQRYQVRLRTVIFSHTPISRTRRVEIPQREILHSVRLSEPPQRALKCQLRFAVGVYRMLRRVFRDGQLIGNSIGCARRRKDEVLHAGVFHGMKKVHATAHIRSVIQFGILMRFGHQRLPGKVKHTFDWVLAECLLQVRRIANVAFKKWGLTDELSMARGHVIEDECFESALG